MSLKKVISHQSHHGRMPNNGDTDRVNFFLLMSFGLYFFFLSVFQKYTEYKLNKASLANRLERENYVSSGHFMVHII